MGVEIPGTGRASTGVSATDIAASPQRRVAAGAFDFFPQVLGFPVRVGGRLQALLPA